MLTSQIRKLAAKQSSLLQPYSLAMFSTQPSGLVFQRINHDHGKFAHSHITKVKGGFEVTMPFARNLTFKLKQDQTFTDLAVDIAAKTDREVKFYDPEGNMLSQRESISDWEHVPLIIKDASNGTDIVLCFDSHHADHQEDPFSKISSEKGYTAYCRGIGLTSDQTSFFSKAMS